jgi:hypothetical protein
MLVYWPLAFFCLTSGKLRITYCVITSSDYKIRQTPVVYREKLYHESSERSSTFALFLWSEKVELLILAIEVI